MPAVIMISARSRRPNPKEKIMASSGIFLDGKDAIRLLTGEGRRMQMLCYTDALMMLRCEFDTSAVGDPHTHPHTQAAYIVSGHFDVTINCVTQRLGQES